MSREVRRVPLDFDHPLNAPWPGHSMPAELHLALCPTCKGKGWSATAEWVQTLGHLFGLAADSAEGTWHHPESITHTLTPPVHPWLHDLAHRPERVPDANMVNLVSGLLGHTYRPGDGVDPIRLMRALGAAAALPAGWETCHTCEGKGDISSEERRALVAAWEPTDPPTGEGWQLWETVSDGTPVTPVFATAEALVDHLVTVGESQSRSLIGVVPPPRPYRLSAAQALVAAGSSAGSYARVGGGPVLDSALDADVIANRGRAPLTPPQDDPPPAE